MSLSWQKVSVFISSTFNDMHAERDYLVKRVFPELREWCEKRKLRLVDIDLRWGVTEEDATKHKNVVKVCLDRIDECRPFFLCFLGQRRGWVPEKGDVSKDTCETYKDLKGLLGNASVTELEILHAAVNPLNNKERSKYSFFYLRDDSYLKDLPDNPPLIRKTYTNEGIQDKSERAIANKELMIWRDEKIPKTKQHVHHYSSIWKKMANTPELCIPLHCQSSSPTNQDLWRKLWKTDAGIDVPDLDIEKHPDLARKARVFNKKISRGRLTDFTSEGKPFRAIILDDLKKAIEERYPDHREIPEESDLQKELDQQEQFLHLNSEGFIKRAGDFKKLDEYAEENNGKIFVLTAAGGLGKTMLLANWIDHYRNKKEGKNIALFYRFIGASDRSTTVDSVLRYLLREIQENFGLFEDEIPADHDELLRAWPNILEKIGKLQKIVIVVDAFNQLESGLSDLRWVPWKVPSGIKLIISFKREDGEAENFYKKILENPNITVSEVQPFYSKKDRKRLVNTYLNQYLKNLDKYQIEAIINTQGTDNPLFLKIILTELRVFGAYANLTNKIWEGSYGEKPVSAFGEVLNRLENDPAYSLTDPRVAVPLLFGLLAHARHGLSEEELVSLFLQELKLKKNRRTKEGLKDTIRLLLRQVRPFLAMRDGRHDFFYESFRLAAIERYDRSTKRRDQRESAEWHRSLAEYFEQLPVWVSQKENLPTLRRAAELPYHLAWAGKSDHLADLILDYELLETIVFGIGPYAAIEDISLIITPPVTSNRKRTTSKDKGMILFQEALILSAHVLLQKPNQLPSQLVGRLLGVKNLIIRKFVARINRFDRYPWLRPINPCLNPPGGSLICTLTGHSDCILALAMTPDGNRAVSGSKGTLMVWDLEKGRELHTFADLPGSICSVAITSDARRAVSGSTERNLTVWDLENWRELFTISGNTGPINALAVTPDGNRAFSAGSINTLNVWDLEKGQEIHTFTNTGWILAVGITPDGGLGVSISINGTLDIWDLVNYRKSHSFRDLTGDGDESKAIAITPDCRRAITGSQDNTLRLWDLEKGQEILPPLTNDIRRIDAVAITPDGCRAVSISGDGTIRVWNLESGQELHSFTVNIDMVKTVAVTSDGHYAVSAGMWDGALRVWDLGISQENLDSSQEIITFHRHHAEITAMAVSPDGRKAISGSEDESLLVWDLESGRILFWFPYHEDLVTAVAVMPDSSMAVSASWDDTVMVWDLENGHKISTHTLNSLSVTKLALTPDGCRAICGVDGAIYLLDLESGKWFFRIDDDDDFADLHITSLTVTPDGRRVVSGCSEYQECILKVWDLESGQGLITCKDHAGLVSAVGVTPDGRKAVSASEDYTLKVWDLESGQECLTFRDHTGPVSAVVVMPDGRMVISGSDDMTLKIWDLENGSIETEFYCDMPIKACGYSHQCNCIIIGDSTGKVYMLRFEGYNPDIPTTTAMECYDGSVRLRCFFCQHWFDLSQGNLGGVVKCPVCRKIVQVNSFTYIKHCNIAKESFGQKENNERGKAREHVLRLLADDKSREKFERIANEVKKNRHRNDS
jgi:WD40 repeat protein